MTKKQTQLAFQKYAKKMENKTWFQIWEMLYLQNGLAIIDFTILDLRTCLMDFSTAEIFRRLVLLQGGCLCCRCFCSCCFRVALCCKIWPNSATMTGLSLMTNMLRLAVNTLRLRTTMEEPCVLIQISVFPKGQDIMDIGEWYDTQQYFTKASSQKAGSQWKLKIVLRIIGPSNKKTDGFDSFFWQGSFRSPNHQFWDPWILREGFLSLTFRGFNSKYQTWSLANVSPVGRWWFQFF